MLKELLAKQLAHKVSKGLDVTEDLNRIDFLFFRGRLTEQEYDELLALVPHEEEEEVVEQPVVDQVIEEQPTIEEVVEESVIVEEVQGEEIPEVVEEEQPEVIIVQPEVVEQEEEQEEQQEEVEQVEEQEEEQAE